MRTSLILAIIPVAFAGGCSSVEQRVDSASNVVVFNRAYKSLKLGYQNQSIVIVEFEGEAALVSMKRMPYPKNTSVPSADAICFSKPMEIFREFALESIAVSFQGVSYHVPVSKSVLFADPSMPVIPGEESTPEEFMGSDDVSQSPLTERGELEQGVEEVGIAWDASSQLVSLAFLGSDGEGSNVGAVIFKGNQVVGVAMEIYDGSSTPKIFAMKSLKSYVSVK
jgi:hypothetical protein